MRKIYFITAISAFCFLVACGERRSALFATGEEALRSEEARSGWVPNWLPVESQEVRLQYDQDTNEVWIRFVLKKSNRINFEKSLKPLSDLVINNINFPRARGAKWWPEGLIQQQPSNDGALNALLFTGDNVIVPSKTYIAFDRISDDVYIWF
jgi:hypothetical protein